MIDIKESIFLADVVINDLLLFGVIWSIAFPEKRIWPAPKKVVMAIFFLSGVYYVQTCAGGDTINFHDPRIQTGIIRPPVTELTAEIPDQIVIKVSNGTLLIFPAYLQHSVDPNRSGEERISISFNMMFSSFTENLSKPLW